MFKLILCSTYGFFSAKIVVIVQVYRALEAVLGRHDMVQETYVLPHNTVLNYVALIGQDGSPLPLPQFFTDQPLDQVGYRR